MADIVQMRFPDKTFGQVACEPVDLELFQDAFHLTLGAGPVIGKHNDVFEISDAGFTVTANNYSLGH